VYLEQAQVLAPPCERPVRLVLRPVKRIANDGEIAIVEMPSGALEVEISDGYG
jgi:hypothetical protein